MILIRHGQSEFNLHFSATRIDPGIPDPKLTPLGEAQAEAAAMSLAFIRAMTGLSLGNGEWIVIEPEPAALPAP